MSKVWILGDTHLGYKNDDERHLQKMTEYLEAVIDKINNESSEGDIFVQLGDLLDRRMNVGTIVLETVIRLFKKLKVDTYIIVGNHDTRKNDEHDIISTSFLEYVSPKIHIIRDITEMSISGKKALFVPYYTPDVAKEKLQSYEGSFDYMFSHLDFCGLKMNKYSVSDTKLMKEDAKAGIIFNGHIHLFQKKDNIINVGSAYELTAADEGNSKNLLMLDTSTNKVAAFKNNMSPRFITVPYNDIQNISKSVLANNNIILEVKCSEMTKTDPRLIAEVNKEAYSMRTVITGGKVVLDSESGNTDTDSETMTIGNQNFDDKVDAYMANLIEQDLYSKQDVEVIGKIFKKVYSNVAH